jgi:hypothetical protein
MMLLLSVPVNKAMLPEINKLNLIRLGFFVENLGVRPKKWENIRGNRDIPRIPPRFYKILHQT